LSWDWTHLISAVVGALVGSVSTFFWVRHLHEQTQKNQKQTENNQRRAAGRAVLAEMMANGNSAVRMKGQGLNNAIPDVAWQSQLHLIAQLVACNT
jgi:membrane protein implicated in regulation of membrane protease activity